MLDMLEIFAYLYVETMHLVNQQKFSQESILEID